MELLLVLKNVFAMVFAVAMVYGMNRMYNVLSEMKEGL